MTAEFSARQSAEMQTMGRTGMMATRTLSQEPTSELAWIQRIWNSTTKDRVDLLR